MKDARQHCRNPSLGTEHLLKRKKEKTLQYQMNWLVLTPYISMDQGHIFTYLPIIYLG